MKRRYWSVLLAAALLSTAASCPPKPQPPGPPAPVPIVVTGHVNDEHGAAVVGATVYWDGGPQAVTDAFGRASIRTTSPARFGFCAKADNHFTQCLDTILPDTPDRFFTLSTIRPPVAVGLERGMLEARGRQVFAGGVPHGVTGVTGFPAVEDWFRDRPKVERFADWMVAHKAGAVRALGMSHQGACAGVGNFGPQDVGGVDAWIHGIGELADYLAERGERLDLQTFADMQTDDCKPNNPLTALNQPDVFARLSVALAGKWNVILGGGNQYSKNGWDPNLLARPPSVFASRGSGLEEQLPILPPWGWAEYHPSRADDFARRAKSAWDLWTGNTNEHLSVPGPIAFTEPIGIGEANESGKTTADPWQMWQFAAASRIFGVQYLVGHARAGITLDVPGPTASATYDAMVDGFTRAPDAFAWGGYDRGYESGSPALWMAHTDACAERTYQMTVGAQAALIVINPAPCWSPVLQNGAHIVSSVGYGHGHPDTVFVLAR